jgi:hypothetical protein
VLVTVLHHIGFGAGVLECDQHNLKAFATSKVHGRDEIAVNGDEHELVDVGSYRALNEGPCSRKPLHTATTSTTPMSILET